MLNCYRSSLSLLKEYTEEWAAGSSSDAVFNAGPGSQVWSSINAYGMKHVPGRSVLTARTSMWGDGQWHFQERHASTR